MKRRKMSGPSNSKERKAARLLNLSSCGDASDNDGIRPLVRTIQRATLKGPVSKSSWSSFTEHLAEPWLRKNSSSSSKTDPLSCQKCEGIPFEPVTASCGHTFCRKCLSGSTTEFKCPTCGKRNYFDQVPLKTNVMVSSLVEKWWADEVQARILRNSGNQLFKQQNYAEAEKNYDQAHHLAPSDFTTLSNRSSLYEKTGRLDLALRDAEQVIQLRPDWPKGYYRRGVALFGLERFHEALVCFLKCVALQKSLQPDVREDIIKVLKKLFVSPDEEDHRLGDAQAVEQENQETTSSSSMKSSVVNNSELDRLVDLLQTELDNLTGLTEEPKPRPISNEAVDKLDFECALCFRLLWQPITTPCGHTFCRCCLDRSLDHNPSCPLCKASLEDFLAERRQGNTEFLEVAMSQYLTDDYNERKLIHEEEMNELKIYDQVPIFVCTMALPCVPCPLHVFEPRYRLMIRRAKESGANEFGMCAYVPEQPGGYAQYGTMVKIRDLQYLPDGRSFVDTVGDRRFKVLRRGVRDGYNTARVEFISDDPIQPEKRPALIELHDSVRRETEQWIRNMPTSLRNRIKSYCGPMPPVENDWISLPSGPAWLWWLLGVLPVGQSTQLPVLEMTSLELRLRTLRQCLTQFQRRGIY